MKSVTIVSRRSRACRLPIRNAMPFTVLVMIWIAAYFVVRIRDERKLQQEIDELNLIERENRE